MRNAVILLACLVGVVAIAGCGGGGAGSNGGALSKEDYETQMQALQAKLDSAGEEFTAAFENPSDIAKLVEGLRDGADLLDEASQSLDEITPPADVADPHQTLTEGSADAADLFREMADTLETTPVSEIQPKLAEFQGRIAEFQQVSAAADEIEAKGYDIGGS